MGKKLAQLSISTFAGAIICSLLSGVVWYLILPLFPEGNSKGFPAISDDAGHILISLLMGCLGLIAGLTIGFLVAVYDFRPMFGAVFGGVIGILIPALILIYFTAEARSRGSAENLLPMIVFFLPQIPICALSGFLVSLVSDFTHKGITK